VYVGQVHGGVVGVAVGGGGGGGGVVAVYVGGTEVAVFVGYGTLVGVFVAGGGGGGGGSVAVYVGGGGQGYPPQASTVAEAPINGSQANTPATARAVTPNPIRKRSRIERGGLRLGAGMVSFLKTNGASTDVGAP